MPIQNHPEIVEPLGRPSTAHKILIDGTGRNQVLTSTCKRISIKAIGVAARYLVGLTNQSSTVGTTSHYIDVGERLDLAVLENTNISVVRDGVSGSGTLEISELV